MSDEPVLTADDLRQFIGTERWHRHGLVRDVLFTDGVKYLADRAGAYWLVDEIAFAQRASRRVAAEPFQLWMLVVRTDRSAELRCEDGDGPLVFEKAIEFTDFPLPDVRLYCVDRILMLPSEY